MPKEFVRVLVPEQSGSGKIFSCVKIGLRFSSAFCDLFGVTDKFGVIIRFSLRHKSVACMDLGVEPTSVRVRSSPEPHTLKLSLPPFCVQSLGCNPRVSGTRGAIRC